MQEADQPSIEEIRAAVREFCQQLKVGHTIKLRRVGSFYGDEYPVTLTPEIMAMLNAPVKPRQWIVEETFEDQTPGSYDGCLYTKKVGGNGAAINIVKEIDAAETR